MRVPTSRSSGGAEGIGLYRRLFFISLPILLVVSLIISILVGAVSIGVHEVFRILLAKSFGINVENDPTRSYIVWNLRLPRALGAAIAGASLASASAIIQISLRNPIASPFTIGLSSAAALGASIAILLGAGFISAYPSVPVIINPWVVILNAFIMCIITIAIIGIVSGIKGSNPVTVILTGIAISYLFGAIVSILQYFSRAEALKAVVIWLLGDLSRMSWEYLRFSLLSTMLIPVAMLFGWRLNALTLGEEVAQSLGVNVKRIRAVSAMLSGLMVALVVPFTGIIGFVDLVSSHIARLVVGSNASYLIPTSAFTGAILLVLADTIARTMVAPLELPVGAVTSLIGGPFFIYLLIRSRRVQWL